MAKFLDKDPFTYEREKRTFLHALRQYHASKGVQVSMFRIPKISGKDLDFHLLYSKVTSLGGLTKVTNEHRWDEVCETLGYPTGCSQIAYVVRRHYVRYLESYEKVHFKGEDDDDKRGPKIQRPNTPITFIYRKEISDKVRQSQGFATEKCRVSEYDRIIHSLLSGLPNEVDFAINICTLLSNEGKHVIHLERAPRLIDLLLAHAGVFYEGPGSLRNLFHENWDVGVKRRFVQFWYDTISDKEVRDVIGPVSKKPEDHRHFSDPELFCVRKLGLSDVEGQRILQIAIIFRNLSFESHNISTMASHRTLYRFLLLLSHNSCTMLQQLGLDTLTNICNQMVLDSIDYVSTQLMLHTIHKGLDSKDKFTMLRAMELIEKLLVVDANLDLVQRCLERTVYFKVVTLLTIQDIQLLLGALEVMLVMSEREEPFCTRLSSVHCSIDVLVCLVTLDAQSLGADAFVGIRIVDHAPDGVHHPIVTMGKAPGVENAPHHGQQGTPSKTPPVQRPVQAPSNSSASATPPPQPQGSQVRDVDMENLACQWLGAHYDSDVDSSISNIDLYAEYLSACGKIMGRNILNSNDFMRCVKIVFPMVSGKKADGEAGPQFFISGIKRRKSPLPWRYQASPSAPSPSASAMIARMAQRHSPSPTVSPSPTPPPKSGVFPQGGVPQRQLVMPPQGSPNLPGQVNGQIPGHIHPSPMVMGTQQMPQHQGQVPGQIHGQMYSGHPVQGQMVPAQTRMLVPGQGNVQGVQGNVQMAPGQANIQGTQGMVPGSQLVSRPPPAYTPPQQSRPQAPLQEGGQPHMVQAQMGQQHVPQYQPQQQVIQGQVPQQQIPAQYPHQMQQSQPQQPQVLQTQPAHGLVSSQNLQGHLTPHSGITTTVALSRPPHQVVTNVSQGHPQQQPVPSHGENVSVADIIAGNMHIPQHQLNYNVAQQNGRPLNGPMQGQLANGPQNEGILGHTTPSETGLDSQSLMSDTNSESSTDVNSQNRNSRSRNSSGRKSPASSKSGRRTPSRQTSKSPNRSPARGGSIAKSLGDALEGATTETCQPPHKVQLPDGEVKIEKIPNVHAVGVHNDLEDGGDRMDVAEDIVRQIAGSPVPNATTSEVPMEGTDRIVTEADTTSRSDTQHCGLNGTVTPTPEPSRQLQPVDQPKAAEAVSSSSAEVFSQPTQQQTVQAAPRDNVATANKPATHIVVSQSHPQQQFVIQKQIPPRFVNVQLQGRQAVLQTQPGTIVHTNPVNTSSGAVIQSNQGSFIQTQTGSYVQVQPQYHVQGHQVVQSQGVVQTQGTIQGQSIQGVVQSQGNIQGHQVQTQMPMQVTWVQQPKVQGQIQQVQQVQSVQPVQQVQSVQHVQQPQVNVVRGVQHLQPGQTMIVTNNGPQGSYPQTIISQNQGQLVVQNVAPPPTPPRTGPKPILPQPQPIGTRAILPAPDPAASVPQQTTQVVPHQMNVQIRGFANIPRIQGQLSPNSKDSPLIKQLLQQGSVVQTQGGQVIPAPGQQLSPHQPQQQVIQQVIQPQQGQIVLNTIGQAQGSPMTHVQVVTHVPQMSVQSAPTIGNMPQIQLHHQPILPAIPGVPSPHRTASKPKKSKSKHKKKDKGKDKEKDKSKDKNGHPKELISKVGEVITDRGIIYSSSPKVSKDGNKSNNYSVNVISEQGDRKIVGVVCNGLPVETKKDGSLCNNSKDPVSQDSKQDSLAKQGMPNGYIGDKISDKIIDSTKDGKGAIVSPLASKDIDALFKNSPQTIGDKVDSLVEQLKRDMSSGASENGILADKLGNPCLNHIVNGEVGPTPKDALIKDNYENNTVSDKIDRLLHGAVPNLSQPNIPSSSTPSNSPNPKSLVAFCNDIRTPFPASVPSLTVAPATNINTTNQQKNNQSVPIATANANSISTAAHPGIDSVQTQNSVSSQITNHGHNNPGHNVNPMKTQGVTLSSSSVSSVSSSQMVTSTSQSPLPPSSQHPSSPLTVQVPNLPSTTPSFKRPIDDVLHSPDSKSSSSSSNSLASPTNPVAPQTSTSKSRKKRRHSSASSTSGRKSSSSKSASVLAPAPAPAPVPTPPPKQYVCEWKGCNRMLTSAKSLHTHSCVTHVLSINYRGLCEWDGCDRIQRQRWSVVSHIMDKHCSEAAVQASMEKRAQRAAQPTPPPSQDSSPQPPPIVYNAHTAYHAIRRSLVNPSLKDLVGENEGPVTKSIRLTAALILKNIATYSALGRREIKRHELLLARLAISNTESSTTLAKCLREINRDS